MRYTVAVTDETGFEVGSLEVDLSDLEIAETREEYDAEMLGSGIDETMSVAGAVIYHVSPDLCPFDCGHCHG